MNILFALVIVVAVAGGWVQHNGLPIFIVMQLQMAFVNFDRFHL